MILTRPLQKLSQVSKQIADGDYSVRVPVHTEDEIGELSVSFNYMTEQLIEKLMKLDQLLKNQEEFMGSFAHEMKTPLTSIIGYADLMRMEALSKEEQKRSLWVYLFRRKTITEFIIKINETSCFEKSTVSDEKTRFRANDSRSSYIHAVSFKKNKIFL